MTVSLAYLGIGATAVVLSIYFARDSDPLLAAISVEVFALPAALIAFLFFRNYAKLSDFDVAITLTWFLGTGWYVLWTVVGALAANLAGDGSEAGEENGAGENGGQVRDPFLGRRVL